MINLFMEGGVIFMSILTLLLVGVLVSAKKYKDKVKPIGVLAFAIGLLSGLIRLLSIFDLVEAAGDISPSLLAGGIKMIFITMIYGLIILIISLVLNIINKTCKC